MTARAEFLARRKGGIGGSDIAAILGLSKFKSAVDVWMDKTGRTADTPSTVPQRFGIFAEDFVAQEYTAKTGRAVVRYTKQLTHPDHDFIIGNVDRLVIPDGAKVAHHMGEIRTDRGMEAKCVSAYSGSEWGDEDSDEVPPYYLAQCAWYRILTGCQYWDLAALIGNHRVSIYTLARDRELESLLVARAVEFWNAHVLTDIPPPPQSAADIAALYPKSEEGRAVVASDDVQAALSAIRAERAAIAVAAEREAAALLVVKSHMMGAEALKLTDGAGQVLATWKNNKDSRKVDYESAFADALRLVSPADVESVRAEIIAHHSTVSTGARPFKIK